MLLISKDVFNDVDADADMAASQVAGPSTAQVDSMNVRRQPRRQSKVINWPRLMSVQCQHALVTYSMPSAAVAHSGKSDEEDSQGQRPAKFGACDRPQPLVGLLHLRLRLR